MDPVAPDLTATPYPWEPVSSWHPGDFDPAALIASLKAQAGLEDYTDDHGVQSRVRLDYDADASNAGFWVIRPAAVDESAVDAGIAAYAPLPAPAVTLDPTLVVLNAALDSIDLATVETPADVITALKSALNPS